MSNIGIDAPAALRRGHGPGALRQHTIPPFRLAISMAVIVSPPGPSPRHPPCRSPIRPNEPSLAIVIELA